jgi:hypothetical protein
MVRSNSIIEQDNELMVPYKGFEQRKVLECRVTCFATRE